VQVSELKQLVDWIVSSPERDESLNLHERLVDLVNRGFVSALLKALLREDEQLQFVASRSYAHYNNFDKLVLISSMEPRYDLRMHVWWPNSHIISTENIHNHKWDFSSVLLTGSYSFEVYEESSTGREMYEYSYVTRAGSDSYQMPFLRQANLELTSEGCMSAGDSYSLSHEILHRVICDLSATTISLVIRGASKKNTARVFTDNQANIEKPISSSTFSVSEVCEKFNHILRLTSSDIHP
jgi:hypothetical protein